MNTHAVCADKLTLPGKNSQSSYHYQHYMLHSFTMSAAGSVLDRNAIIFMERRHVATSECALL